MRIYRLFGRARHVLQTRRHCSIRWGIHPRQRRTTREYAELRRDRRLFFRLQTSDFRLQASDSRLQARVQDGSAELPQTRFEPCARVLDHLDDQCTLTGCQLRGDLVAETTSYAA